jgi:hypothetical protein
LKKRKITETFLQDQHFGGTVFQPWRKTHPVPETIVVPESQHCSVLQPAIVHLKLDWHILSPFEKCFFSCEHFLVENEWLCNVLNLSFVD